MSAGCRKKKGGRRGGRGFAISATILGNDLRKGRVQEQDFPSSRECSERKKEKRKRKGPSS